jgi:hypothetical protein
MSPAELKEANRLFWIVKSRLIPDTWDCQTIKDMHADFFKRLWYNEEAYIHEEGFEESYQKKVDLIKLKG